MSWIFHRLARPWSSTPLTWYFYVKASRIQIHDNLYEAYFSTFILHGVSVPGSGMCQLGAQLVIYEAVVPGADKVFETINVHVLEFSFGKSIDHHPLI